MSETPFTPPAESSSVDQSPASRNGLRIVVVAIVAAASLILRLMPHEANFATMLTLSVFCGIVIRRPWAVLIPLAVRLVTDASIGFYSSLMFDYSAYVLAFAIGYALGKPTWARAFGGSAASVVVFFLVSNFGVWFMSTTGDDSPRTLASLMTTYKLGLPFVRPQIVSNLLAVPIFFGLWQAVNVVIGVSPDVRTSET